MKKVLLFKVLLFATCIFLITGCGKVAKKERSSLLNKENVKEKFKIKLPHGFETDKAAKVSYTNLPVTSFIAVSETVLSNTEVSSFMDMADNWLGYSESEPNEIINLRTFAEFASTYRGDLRFLKLSEMNPNYYYTWGISGDDLDIPDGSIITEAVLTIHKITNWDNKLHIHIVDNPPLDFITNIDSKKNRDIDDFDGVLSGYSYRRVDGEYPMIYYQIDDPNSWVRDIFDNPFDFQSISSSISPSSLSELINYDHNSKYCGMGFFIDFYKWNFMFGNHNPSGDIFPGFVNNIYGYSYQSSNENYENYIGTHYQVEEDPNSWVWNIFETSFDTQLIDSPILSASLIERLGVIGDTTSFGVGFMQDFTSNVPDNYDDFFRNFGGTLSEPDYNLVDGDLVITFSQIDDQNSWTWDIYNYPFDFQLADTSVVSYSSSLLELIDYAGNSTPFGIGFDPEGNDYKFKAITLELTIKSYEEQSETSLLTFKQASY